MKITLPFCNVILFSCTDAGFYNRFRIFGLKITIRKKVEEKDYPNALKLWYHENTGEKLDLINPKTYNEKIQWLKLYDSTPIKTQLADKYLVREYIKNTIGEQYLIPLLGVWENADDIHFNELPEQFVLKCNHGSGYNIIVKDKSKLNIRKTKRKLNKWLKEDFSMKFGAELHYKNIPRRIIAEEYVVDSNDELNDYKVLCFNGEPRYIWVDYDRHINHTRNIYNTMWEIQPFTIGHPNSKTETMPPPNLIKILEFAKKLSKDFYFARIDFYQVENEFLFGEITFTSASGIEKFTPAEFNYKLGDLLKLPTDN